MYVYWKVLNTRLIYIKSKLRVILWRRGSSISLWLLRNKVILFFSIIDQLNGVSVLSSSHWLLSLLIGNKWLGLIQVIDFSFGISQVISLIKSSEHRGEEIRCGQKEKLRHVKDVEELGSIPHIKPHPISVRLQSYSLQSQDFQEVRASTWVPMVTWLVFIKELWIVILHVIVVRISHL